MWMQQLKVNNLVLVCNRILGWASPEAAEGTETIAGTGNLAQQDGTLEEVSAIL